MSYILKQYSTKSDNTDPNTFTADMVSTTASVSLINSQEYPGMKINALSNWFNQNTSNSNSSNKMTWINVKIPKAYQDIVYTIKLVKGDGTSYSDYKFIDELFVPKYVNEEAPGVIYVYLYKKLPVGSTEYEYCCSLTELTSPWILAETYVYITKAYDPEDVQEYNIYFNLDSEYNTILFEQSRTDLDYRIINHGQGSNTYAGLVIEIETENVMVKEIKNIMQNNNININKITQIGVWGNIGTEFILGGETNDASCFKIGRNGYYEYTSHDNNIPIKFIGFPILATLVENSNNTYTHNVDYIIDYEYNTSSTN